MTRGCRSSEPPHRPFIKGVPLPHKRFGMRPISCRSATSYLAFLQLKPRSLGSGERGFDVSPAGVLFVEIDAIVYCQTASAFFWAPFSGFLGGGPNSAFFNSLMLSESRGHSQENEGCAQFFVRDLKSLVAAGGLGFSRGNGVLSVSVLKLACCNCSCCCSWGVGLGPAISKLRFCMKSK